MDMSDLEHQLRALGDAIRETDDTQEWATLARIMSGPDGATLREAWRVIESEIEAGHIR